MPKKKVINAELKIHSDFNIPDEELSFLAVQHNGYKARFEEDSQRDLVTHLLREIEGYEYMVRVLCKAINLIKEEK